MPEEKLEYAIENKKVRIATSLAELDAWGSAYERFLAQLGDHSIFYQKGWLGSIWPAYSLQPGNLFFVGVWENEELLAVAPFQMLRKGPLQGWRRLVLFIGTHHRTLINPWPEVLVSEDRYREECIHAICSAFSQCKELWDQVELTYWEDDSPNQALLRQEWPDTGLLHGRNSSALIKLEQGYDNYYASLSRNLRHQVRRRRRRVEAEAGGEFLCTDHLSASRWSAIREMHYQRQRRLNLKGHDRYSIFGNNTEAEALRAALKWAESQGRARHYWLDIDGEPAAFGLGLFNGTTYFYYFIGMDERAEPYSGGMLLLSHLIEEEAKLGMDRVDLMLGMSRNKRRFTTHEVGLSNRIHENERRLSTMRNGWHRFASRITGRREPAEMILEGEASGESQD